MNTATAPASEKRAKTTRRSLVSDVLPNYAVVLFLIALCVLFTALAPDLFPTTANAKTIINNQSVPALLALAVVLPLAAGEFDLSVGAVLGFTAIVAAKVSMSGAPVLVAVLAAVAVGALIGMVNAVLIVRIGVSAFIATLGMATVLSGGNLWLTNGSVLYEGISKGLVEFSRSRLFGLPAIFYYMLLVAVILWVLLERTPYGRYLTATGLGRNSARLAGVSTNYYLSSAFVLSGAIAGLAGVLQTGMVGSASPSAGPDYLLPAYAAAFLGATTIRRGRFNVGGTLVGVLVLAVGVSGLNLLGAPFWVAPVFNGCALLLAVAFAAIVAGRGKGKSNA